MSKKKANIFKVDTLRNWRKLLIQVEKDYDIGASVKLRKLLSKGNLNAAYKYIGKLYIKEYQ